MITISSSKDKIIEKFIEGPPCIIKTSFFGLSSTRVMPDFDFNTLSLICNDLNLLLTIKEIVGYLNSYDIKETYKVKVEKILHYLRVILEYSEISSKIRSAYKQLPEEFANNSFNLKEISVNRDSYDRFNSWILNFWKYINILKYERASLTAETVTPTSSNSLSSTTSEEVLEK